MTTDRTCPVCGFAYLHEPPRVGGGGSYEICPSCGFEFGVTDDDLGFTYEQWRERWIVHGMPWSSSGVSRKPPEWDPVAQLKNVVE